MSNSIMTSSKSGGGGLKQTILAVDNAPMFLSTLKRLLENEPYEIHSETSGEAALTYLQSGNPNLIMLDIEMPDMDGYELCRRIKQYNDRVPILFVTANNDKPHADRAFEAGAAGILIKPLRHDRLVEKIREVMR